MISSSKPFVPLLILVLLGTIWGTGYSIAHFAMTNGVPALGYSFWQSIGPAVIITIITIVCIKRIHLDKKYLLYYFASGLTGIVIPNTAMYYAAAHLPAGVLAIIVNTVPIIAYPMALLANLEQFNLQRLLGIILAVVALMLISIPKSSLPDSTMSPWVLMTLITPISFAACSVIIAKFRPANSHTLELTAGMLVMSSLILAPIVYFTGNYYQLSIPLTLPDQIILLEILLSSIGYVLFFQLIKIAGPVYYSMVDTIVVITGITWGYLLFNETLNRWTGSAVIFIILALWLVTNKQKSTIPNE